MAIKKTITLPNGFTAEYWKITHDEFDHSDNVVYIDCNIYKDKDARDAGREPVLTKRIQIPYPDVSAISNISLRQLLYDLIKEQPDYSDALDI